MEPCAQIVAPWVVNWDIKNPNKSYNFFRSNRSTSPIREYRIRFLESSLGRTPACLRHLKNRDLSSNHITGFCL